MQEGSHSAGIMCGEIIETLAGAEIGKQANAWAEVDLTFHPWARQGDSGGPVYSGVTARGLMTHVSLEEPGGTGNFILYNKIGFVLNELGLPWLPDERYLLRESTMRQRPDRQLRTMWWLALLAVIALAAWETDDQQAAGSVDDPAISTLDQSDRTEVANSVPGESIEEVEEPPVDTEPTSGDSRPQVAEADVTPSEVFNVEILTQTIAGVDWFLYRYVDDGSDSFWTMSAVDGQVDFDAQSGCVYRALNGDRDPAVWPRGTTISATGDSLVLRSGEVLEDGAGFEGGGGGLPVPTLIERCPVDSGSDAVGIGLIDPTED